MKKFWVINITIATLMLIVFFLIIITIFNTADNLDINIVYFQSLFYIICLTVIQFIVGLVYYIIKIKQHSLWTILALFYLICLFLLEISISFGLLGGFLGDM